MYLKGIHEHIIMRPVIFVINPFYPNQFGYIGLGIFNLYFGSFLRVIFWFVYSFYIPFVVVVHLYYMYSLYYFAVNIAVFVIIIWFGSHRDIILVGMETYIRIKIQSMEVGSNPKKVSISGKPSELEHCLSTQVKQEEETHQEILGDPHDEIYHGPQWDLKNTGNTGASPPPY